MKSICPYCRGPITEDEVPECPACHVPHHLECWLENKGCSVPGCSQAPDDESKIVVPSNSFQGGRSGEPPVFGNTPPPQFHRSAPLLIQLASQGQLLLSLASQGQRLSTLLFDSFFIAIFAVSFGFLMGMSGLGELLLNINTNLLMLIVYCIYYIPQEALSGRTLGKLIAGTKAVNEDGSELTLGRAFGRTLCRFIPLECFSFFGGNGRIRGWHDSIPGTKVISVRRT